MTVYVAYEDIHHGTIGPPKKTWVQWLAQWRDAIRLIGGEISLISEKVAEHQGKELDVVEITVTWPDGSHQAMLVWEIDE